MEKIELGVFLHCLFLMWIGERLMFALQRSAIAGMVIALTTFACKDFFRRSDIRTTNQSNS